MADKLESYFKKHLSDESSEGDDWNIPSDTVWKNALPEIQKKSGVFIPWKYLYWIGLISIVGMGIILFIWNYQNSDNPLSNDISENQILENQNNNPSKTAIISENIKDDDGNNIETTDNKIPFDNSTHASNNKKLETSASNIVVTNHEDNIDNGIKEVAYLKSENLNTGVIKDKKTPETATIIVQEKNSGNEVLSEKGTLLNNPKDNEKVTTSDYPALSNTTPLFSDSIDKRNQEYKATLQSDMATNVAPEEEENDVIGNIDNLKKKQEPINHRGKLGIGIFYSPTFTATYLTGDLVSGITKTPSVFLYSGYYGIDIKYHISNRFSIVSGIGRSEIRSWSKSSVDFEYETSTEHTMNTGEKENTSPVPMPSPFGTINTEVTYRFPGSDEIPDGELMQSVLETHQDVKYLTIPLGVEFNIVDRSRLTWFTEGGLGFNRATKDATKFNSRIIHYGNDMKVVSEEITGHPTYKDYYFSYYLGTGLKYSLSKNIQARSSIRYNGNISAVNLQNGMSTNLHATNLKLGIFYFF
jgi:opacity protein-like surface antigen